MEALPGGAVAAGGGPVFAQLADQELARRLTLHAQPRGKCGDAEARRINDLATQPLARVHCEAVVKLDRHQ